MRGQLWPALEKQAVAAESGLHFWHLGNLLCGHGVHAAWFVRRHYLESTYTKKEGLGVRIKKAESRKW